MSDEPASAACANCGTPLRGPFCHACGQRDRDPTAISVRAWVAEWADQVFSLDARLWRTLGTLVRHPGRLTVEVLAGRRVRWLSPLRLFLVSALVLVVVGGLVGAAPFTLTEAGESRALTDEERREALAEAGDDAPELLRRLVSADPAEVNREILARLAQAAILLVPVFALALQLLYRRRYRRYVPHLVFALHFYSFAFLVAAIALAGDQLPGLRTVRPLTLAAAAVIPGYLWLAQRRVYRVGRLGATLGTVALGGVGCAAGLLLLAGLLLVVLWAAG